MYDRDEIYLTAVFPFHVYFWLFLWECALEIVCSSLTEYVLLLQFIVALEKPAHTKFKDICKFKKDKAKKADAQELEILAGNLNECLWKPDGVYIYPANLPGGILYVENLIILQTCDVFLSCRRIIM